MSRVDASPYQVFLSYSSHDRQWADAACAALERGGVRCWIAPRDITPGTEWGAAIVDGIDRCRVMVLVFSGHANDSAQVRREVERAIGKGLAVLPLRVEDVPPRGSMEYALSNTHWLDAFAPPAEERLRLLVDAVTALLGLKAAAPAPQPATTPVSPPGSRRKSLWLVLAAAGLVALSAVIFAIMRGRDGEPSSPIGGGNSTGVAAATSGQSPAPANVIDQSPLLQGAWVAGAETTPDDGPLSPEASAKRQHRWVIRDQNLVTEFYGKRGVKNVYRGEITFRQVDGKNLFDFRGGDGKGNRQTWTGIYNLDDGVLAVCYRVQDKPSAPSPERPSGFPSRGERAEQNAYFIRFRRSQGETKPVEGKQGKTRKK